MVFQTLIDVHSLRDMLGKPQLVVLDCRFDLANPDAGRAAYFSGHIPGARFADVNRDLAGTPSASSGRHPLPAPAVLAERLSRFGIGEGSQVVAYDAAHGSAAARLWWLLRWLGHFRVAVLDGGIKAWTAQGLALQAGDVGEGADRTRFVPRANSDAVIGTTGLEHALRDAERDGQPRCLLVDARAAERFAGTVEPIDPIAGHVPGAVNHPFTSNLDAAGCFLPSPKLRSIWADRLAGRDPRTVVAMCGSGITACHNLLALEVAGFPGGRLYAGSWSEWIRDPGRPVARFAKVPPT